MLKALLLALALLPAAAAAAPAELTQWRSGLIELNDGWAEHPGDNMAWAQPDFDDSAWQKVDIEDLGAAKPGWRWFRLHVNLGPDHPNPRFLLDGGYGAYEIYVNGQRLPETKILSDFAIVRPTERVFELSNERGDFEIAIRTRTSTGYACYGFPLFISVTMGGETAIDYERDSLESDRLYSVAPSIAICLLLFIAGLGALALYFNQPSQRDYLFLALFLLIMGSSNGVWRLQQAGLLPISANFFFADPMGFPASIAQLEFVFSFARRRVSLPWRIYEAIILMPLLAVVPTWSGYISGTNYSLLEAAVAAPLAFLLPAVLLAWYRCGNREAGWLIFPSLLPSATSVLFDLGIASVYPGWNKLGFLIQPIPIGPIPLAIVDVGNLLFLLAIGIVMIVRFTRVSREQARSAAELDAARDIQRRLVPAALPPVAGYKIETAYLPAQEVGGDFYQILGQTDGSTLIVVGDVSGKGLKAAMTGALAIGALRALSAELLAPAILLARLSREILRAEDGGFITCLCARVSPSGAVLFANAGHLSPYRNGEEVQVDSGLPLGIAPDAMYTETTLQLQTGDSLMLLSDGVVEARSPSGELFGFERTTAISTQNANQIAKAAEQWGQEDDITVLTVAFIPE